MNSITTKNLTKSFKTISKERSSLRRYFFPKYQEFTAVSNLNLQVKKGERVALVGPNGAGKSTTIKMLTGILTPTSGQVEILGKDPKKERKALTKEMSVLFGHCSKLWFHLPPMDSFLLLGSIYDIEDELCKKRIKKLSELFGVEHLLDRPVKKLSLGERMRCELVASFLHEPKLVFLDEPTIGLDVVGKALIRKHLKDMCQDLGCTLILTSHDTDDIEFVCDRMILIKNGETLLDDGLSQIKKTHLKKKKVTLLLSEESEKREFEGSTLIDSDPMKVIYEIDLEKSSVNALIPQFMSAYKVVDISIEDPSLESIITSLYKG